MIPDTERCLALAAAAAILSTGIATAAEPRLPSVIGLIPIGGSVFTTGLNQKDNEIYVVNSDNGKLYVINGKTDKVKETIDLGTVVNGMAYNSQTDQLIFANLLDNSISIMNRKTMKFVGTPIPTGLHAAKIVVDEQTNHAYVSNMHTGTVSVVDLAKRAVVTDLVIGTGAPTPPGCNPWDSNNPCTTEGSTPLEIAINQKTHKVYVAAYLEGTVTVIDTLRNRIDGARIPVGSQPNGISVNETTNRVYISNWQDGNVSVIDGKTGSLIGEPVTVGSGLQDPPDCYEAGKLDACKHWGSMPLDNRVNEKTNRIYVANSNDGTISVINGKTNKLIGDVPVTTGVPTPNGCENFGACVRGSSAQTIQYNATTDKLYVGSMHDGWIMVLKGKGTSSGNPHH